MNQVAVVDRSHMGSVEELMKILMVSNLLHEQQQVDLLMNHIAEAERNHLAVMQELSDIKNQLNEILSRTDTALSGLEGTGGKKRACTVSFV